MTIRSWVCHREMKMRRVIVLVVGVCCLLGGTAGAEEIIVSDEGEATAAIVHNGYEDPGDVLREYLEKISGAELSLVEDIEDVEGDNAAISLEVVDELPGTSGDRTADHAYRLHSEDGEFVISAQTELGLEYGVYGLLQNHLGVGFYSEEYEHIPDLSTLPLPDVQETFEPAFYHRNPMHFEWSQATGEETKVYARKNRQFPPTGTPHNANHNFRNFDTWDNCPLDEEFQDDFAEQLAKKFEDRDADGAPFGLGQMDGPFKFGCGKCENCQELIEKEGSEAAPMLVMLNGVMERLEDEYPDHEIMTFAYWNTLPVPENVRPHENIWIQIVSSDASLNQAGDHLGTIRDNVANRLYEEALREWPQVHDKVTTWHWATGGEYEWPNLFNHIDDIRLWDEYGVHGAQEQTASGVSNANWSELKYWVWEQLKWDPDQDADELVDRFLREYYGEKAAPHVREFLETSDELRADSGFYVPGGLVRWSAWSVNMRRKFLNLEATEKLAEILERANEAAAQEDNPVYAEHLAEASARSLDPVIIDAVREAEGFARVENPEDGTPWYVPGGREDMPRRIERAMPDDRRKEDWFKRRAGGRIYELNTDKLRTDVVPNYRGRIVNIVHKPTQKEILAADGYSDVLGARNHIQRIEEATEDEVITDVLFGGGFWSWGKPDHLRRTVMADANEIAVERHFQNKTTSADARWELRMPNPAAARVHIQGGGLDEQYSGDELVYRAETIKHELGEAGEEDAALMITLDRGDGLVVEIETTEQGWKNVQLLPDVVSQSEQFDMDQHLLDPQITPEGEMEMTGSGRFDWRRRPNWPGDYDVWPRDRSAMVRVMLKYGGVIDKEEGTLPQQKLTVREDGEEREAEIDISMEEPEEDAGGREPEALEIVDEGR
ncbi:MAG: DUF4838 domain-containing protein, partial [Candidatus Brocadiia bacterium]